MKTIKKYLIMCLAVIGVTSCMNDWDEEYYANPPYGNNSIGAPNMTIAEFKEKFKSELQNSSPTEVTEDIVLKGVIVCNDESGNIYKQLVINDETDAILLSVNAVGMYATLPIGQMIAVDVKGLSIGGYGKLPQIGEPYNSESYGVQIGRMSEIAFQEHIKLLGSPNLYYSELTPTDLTEEFLSDSNNKDLLPRYVRLTNVEFEEADGTAKYAPEEEASSSNVVERNIKIGSSNVVFRLSTYAQFANKIIPQGKHNIVGVLTRYNNYWQFMLSSDDDITPAE